MNSHHISPDDPRLTAYALDELDPAERAQFESLLQQDNGAQQVVANIRAAANTLCAALAEEPAESVAPEQTTGPAPAAPSSRTYRKLTPFPYWLISSLAAACFAVGFVIWQRDYESRRQDKRYVEVPLSPPRPDTTSSAAAPELMAKVAPKPDAYTLTSPSAASVPTAEADTAWRLAQTRGREIAADKIESERFNVNGPTAAISPAARMMAPPQPSVPAYSYTAHEATMRPPTSSRGVMNTEAYAYRQDNTFLDAKGNPLSTFSIDVDTASYANVRRFLAEGRRPPPDAVRVEELVNYFPYHYAAPTGTVPFAATLEVASAPWAPEHRLVRIGLKGREVSDAARPAANLVFLLDVSGSMDAPNKLPLVKQSLRLLLGRLRADDRVAIVIYAGASGLALPSTPVARKAEILGAIEALVADGSTNGTLGIQLAYDVAKANFIPDGVNRVILATDGDFNVGVTSEGDLTRLIEEKAKTGVFLTVLGFGMGNYKDSTLELLSDKGNGNYAYIDTLAEAKKMLGEQVGGTLVTIAKDVKLQVEFNPLEVRAYRLIGYENRLLHKEDFKNDKVDAGEIGSGHTVTALYEVVPVGAEMPAETPAVDALKYQRPANPVLLNHAELLTVKIRYKQPAGEVSNELEFPLRDGGAKFADASQDFKFAASVAAFGMILRESPHKGAATLGDVLAWAQAGTGSDEGGHRAEFLGLVERARALPQ